MKKMFKNLSIILLLIIVAQSNGSTTTTTTTSTTTTDNYDNVPLKCPRDCVCEEATSTATCRFIDDSIQQFGANTKVLVIRDDINYKPQITLSANIFKNLGLKYVNKIVITNITIASMDVDTFNDLEYLTTIEMHSTDLAEDNVHMLEQVFNRKSTKHLKAINLSDNEIRLSNNTVITSSTCEELILQNNHIEELTANTFNGLLNLIYINLNNNRIRKIDVMTFKKLVNLEELDLSNNQIKTIPMLLFTTNTELSYLKLINNPLTIATSTVQSVINSESLETLDLNSCQIGPHINEHMFIHIPNIIDLKLYANHINSIDVNAFKRTTQLYDLDLSYNAIQELPADLFKYNVELKLLNISNNRYLSELPANGFNIIEGYIFNIIILDASSCSLRALTNHTFKHMIALTDLYLNDNQLTSVDEDVFNKLYSLKYVNLANNNLSALPANIFKMNRNLNHLNLSNNPNIKRIAANTFNNLQNLVILDVSSCGLVDHIVWSNDNKSSNENKLVSLKYLNVSNNGLAELDDAFMSYVPNVLNIDLSANRLKCNQQFTTFIQWLIAHNVQIELGSEQQSDEFDKKARWNQLTKSVCRDQPIVEQISHDLATNQSMLTSTENTDDYYIADDFLDDDDDDEDEDEEDDIYDNVNNEDNERPLQTSDATQNKNKNDNLTNYDANYDYAVFNDNEDALNDNDNDNDNNNDNDDELIDDTYAEYPFSNFTNVVMFLIGAVSSAGIVFLLTWCTIALYRRRMASNKYNSNINSIITKTLHLQQHEQYGSDKTKKDCGLVYKQLSEELNTNTGSTTTLNTTATSRTTFINPSVILTRLYSIINNQSDSSSTSRYQQIEPDEHQSPQHSTITITTINK